MKWNCADDIRRQWHDKERRTFLSIFTDVNKIITIETCLHEQVVNPIHIRVLVLI